MGLRAQASYYYWTAKKAATATGEEAVPAEAKRIEKYAWTDEGRAVKCAHPLDASRARRVYVDFAGVGDLPGESVRCGFSRSCADLCVVDADAVTHRLLLDDLANAIDPPASRVIVKKDKLVIVLAKAEPSPSVPWHGLLRH